MARSRHGVGQIPFGQFLVDLPNGGPNQRLAAIARIDGPSQFHDSQQVVAEPGKPAAHQSGDLIQSPLPPDPIVAFERE